MISPGRAAVLSALIPGWGQFRLGRTRAGRLLLGSELAAWALLLIWVPFPALSPVFSIVAGILLIILKLSGSFHAVYAAGGRGLKLLVVICSLIFLFAEQVAVSLAMRFLAFESFKIASGAQEPTLMGPVSSRHSPAFGCRYGARHTDAEPDRILVSKLAYHFGDVRRWDTVCFRFPLNPERQFVKRIIGMPGEEVMIQAGEIWMRSPGDPVFHLARKPPASQETAWIDLEANSLRSRAEFIQAWEANKSGDFQVIDGGLRSPPGFRYSWAHPIEDAEGPIDDRLFSCEAKVEGAVGEVLAEIRTGLGRVEARWAASGSGELRFFHTAIGNEVPKSIVPILRTLQPGRFHRLALAVVDGRAVAWMDAEEVAQYELLRTSSELPAKSEAGGITFGSSGTQAEFTKLRVARDLQWRAGRVFEEKQVVNVPAQHYFVLGDNSESSLDSRGWTRVTVTMPNGAQAFHEQQVDEESSEGMIQGVDAGGRSLLIPRDAPQVAQEPFRFIHRNFMIGRVYRVWWPLQRARAIN